MKNKTQLTDEPAISSNGMLPAVFVVIQCGYEGIQGLIYASAEGSDASAKVKTLRAEILNAIERMKKILAEHGEEEDEDFNTYYDRMLHKKEIEWEEYNNAKYCEPDAYCVQKWDGQKFSCACKELDCEPEKAWLM
jgi:hypothetical protein